uniref:Guanylate cyclase domain-containing protein n=2 Tax=Ditylum brightwellii TaxID=49249 RepID=A0A7S4SA71_9STRA
MRMKDALDELNFERFSLGVSFGECFCGEVGPSIRADYVVMGTEVNMAARLMGKAPNRGILASKRVYTNSKKFILFRQSEHLKVKGKDGFFHAYIPEARAFAPSTSIIDDGNLSDSPEQPFILLPSREYEMTKMLRALHEAEVSIPKVLILCGGPFLGKSRMISSLSENAISANFTVLQSFRTSLDSFTSYFPFRQITLTALLMCASKLLGQVTDDEVAAIEMLIENKILTKTDRVVLGSILPTVSDSQLLSLLKGQSTTALTKSISDTLIKLFVPLQPIMVVFEGDGEIDPSSWSVISEMQQRAVVECSRLLLVISSRNVLTIPSAVSHLQREAEYAKLTPLDKYETEIYLEVLLGVHDKGIGVDQKLLDAVHDRANGCPSFIEYIVSWALGKKMIEYDEGKNVMSFNLPVTQSEDVAAAIPKELSSIVLASFNDLPAILWDVLKIASCIGFSFDENAYEALDENLDFMPRVKTLAATHDVFERIDGHRYKWKHQAVYEAVKSLLIGNQRAQIHSMIVDVFEHYHKNGHFSNMVKCDLHRLFAWHCTLAGKWDAAYNQYMEAGKRAEETYNFPEAAKMYEEAISSQKKIDPLPLLRSRLLPTVKLGNCLRELARYNDAEEVLKTCLEEAERAMKKSDADEQMYVHSLTALAALNQAQSKYNEAKELYEKALPIARNLQESRTSLWLAVHIAGYAETLRKSGDLPTAETLHWEALHIRSCSANEGACTSLELAISYTQLGCTLFGQKKYEEAYKQHRLALKTRFEYLDFSHGHVSESLNYCAEALCSLGRAADGIPLAIHAVNIRKVVFGTSHPAYAHALSILASCYHAVGRSCDARDYFEECLSICEAVFQKNHANIIPNLMNYGKVLCSTGDYEKAKSVFQRAIVIHKKNFTEGQRASELETCQSQVQELTEKIESNTKALQCASVCERNMPIPTVDIKKKGTPIIVITDIGRDVDDEYALVLLASLARMHLLDPIAVVATLSPQRERAYLARGVLDILGFPNIPIGIGSCGGAKGKAGLDVYSAEYSRSCSCIYECGVELMARALSASPDKSVQVFCIGSLTDAATLMKDHEELFVKKVKEVSVMGGLNEIEEGKFVVPDTAYNNNCDAPSAAYVYQKCQELCIPTITLSRYAAYGCPIPTAVLDNLKKTEHMVVNNIVNVRTASINELWKKVNMPTSDTRREKLPPRCNRLWFCQTFLGRDDVETDGASPIMSHVEKLNMYDPLALLCCVPAYREAHFRMETVTVNGVPQSVVGLSQDQTGIVDPEVLCAELFSLFRLAFLRSLQNICKRRVAMQRTSMDF